MIDIVSGPQRDLKNIRQIGAPAEGDRIYIENSAYARVHEESYEERRVFIFMGHTECEEGIYTTFVEAAIPVRDMTFAQNLPQWSTHAWSDVFREIKRSYENSIIVGWAFDCKGFSPRLTAELEAVHREQFGGAHQVLFLMDSLEGEEYFYLHRGNHLQQKNGFYIYYARELHEVRMPDVTVELPRRGSLQTLPEADRKIRKRYQEKVKEKEQKNKNQTASEPPQGRKASSYAMAASIALLLMLVGAGVWQQRIKIPGMEQTVDAINQRLHPAEVLIGSEIKETQESQTTQKATETISEPLKLVPIEEVPQGEVKKITETQDTQASEQKETQEQKEVADTQVKETQTKEQSTPASVDSEQYYVVKQGDTLSGICQKAYGNITKLKELEEVNHLENSDAIKEGQKLLLP